MGKAGSNYLIGVLLLSATRREYPSQTLLVVTCMYVVRSAVLDQGWMYNRGNVCPGRSEFECSDNRFSVPKPPYNE